MPKTSANESWLRRITNGRIALTDGASPLFLIFVGVLIAIYITDRLDAGRGVRKIEDVYCEI